MAMIVTITTSGGIGGFGLGRSAEVAVDSLPEPLKAEACERLDPAALGGLEARPAPGADRVTYHIAVGTAQGTTTFSLAETALPPETLDLIDDLMAQGSATPTP